MRHALPLLLSSVVVLAPVDVASAGAPIPNAQRSPVEETWVAFGAGEFDRLATYCAEDMIFVFPGQGDVLEGRAAFRATLDGLAAALPPGFAVTGMRHLVGEDEVATVATWTSDMLPDGSQAAILFRLGADGLISEERWVIDTEEWKSAF